jgi:iron complex outermembrane receptor protein
MTRRLWSMALAWAAAGSTSMGAGVALAQNASDTNASGGLEEVVVSAQRRDESAQDVPISITALSGQQLEAAGIESLLEIAQVTPGLQFQAIGASSVPFLRGVGAAVSSSGAEATVAIVVDGVYIAAQPASLMSLSNVESVEVDKGPQGTLFGRNATGGVIQVRTRRPTQESQLDFTVGYGNYETADATLYGSTGITSTLAADIALSYHDQNKGYGTNLFDGSDIYTGYDYVARTKWLWTLSDSTEITFIGDWEKLRSQTGFATRMPNNGELGLDQRGRGGFQYSGGFYDVNLDFPSGNLTETKGGSIDWVQRFGGANLRSITAYHTQDVEGRVDFDLGPNHGSHQLFKPTQKTFSEELQLLSPEGAKLTWVAGLYYFHDTSGYDPVFIDYPQPNAAGLNDTTIVSDMKTKSWSAFGQTTIPLPADTRLTLGVRYTNDKRDMRLDQLAPAAPPASVSQVGSETWPKTTFRVGLDHRFSEDVLGYVQGSTGFKSGLFNTQTVQSVPGQPASVPLAVQPEKITAYEVGLKSDWLQNRLRFNIAAFYYDYKDQQVNAFIGSTRTLLNAASSKIKGIDFELTGKPSDVLTLSWTGSFLHARYDSFPTAPLFVPVPAPGTGNLASPRDASGNDDVNSPDFTTTLAVNYRVPVGANRIDLNANAYYNSGYFFDFANTRKQESYTWLNASAKWTFGNNAAYSFSVYGDNLLDEEVYSSVNQVGLGPAGLFGGDSLTIRPPRTYGVRFGASF